MKLLWIFRAIFFVIIVAVLIVSLSLPKISGEVGRANFWVVFWSGFGMFILILVIDILTPKKSLAALAGVFFGLLVGIFFSWGLAQVLDMLNEIYKIGLIDEAMQGIKWMMGVSVCFLIISIVMRTKDDVRFVIPYVEFAKQTKGSHR